MCRNGHGDAFLDGIIVRGIFGGENRLELLFARSAYRESAVFPSPAFGKSYVCKRVLYADREVFGRSIYGHCLGDCEHRLHIVNCIVVCIIACKLRGNGVFACVYLSIIYIIYTDAVRKIARDRKAVRLAVVGHGRTIERNTRHIVGVFCNSYIEQDGYELFFSVQRVGR